MKRIVTLFSALLLMLVSVAQESSAVSRATVTDYPFVLTTDTSNPIYYYIYSGRDGSKVGAIESMSLPVRYLMAILNINLTSCTVTLTRSTLPNCGIS